MVNIIKLKFTDISFLFSFFFSAFIALAVVFISIILHLSGKPFDVNKPNSKRLHDLEFVALTVCFFTFWGGLLFFLGSEKPGSVSIFVQIFTSIFMVGSNSLFLIVATILFFRQYLNDRKAKSHRRRTRTNANMLKDTKTINEDDGLKEWKADEIKPGEKTSSRTKVMPIDNDLDEDQQEEQKTTKPRHSCCHSWLSCLCN